jgi:hypothetical protein
MEILTKSQLENALCDVRKAFRLLYHYQRRVLDLVKFIGDNLEFNYKGGNSIFSNTCPRNGGGRLENWAWDWINMYYYEFHFGSKVIAKNNITFSIFIQSDTGFFDIENTNRLAVESFSSVECAKTRLIFVIGKNVWDISPTYPNSKIFNSQNIISSKELPNGGLMLIKAYNLSEFIDEESTRLNIKDFISFCEERHIFLK